MIAEILKLLYCFVMVSRSIKAEDEIPLCDNLGLQRPMEGPGLEIVKCSLPLGSRCGYTGRAKDIHEYCQCAEGMTCVYYKCRRIPGYTGKVLEGIVRTDEVCRQAGYPKTDDEVSVRNLEELIMQPRADPVVQRPVDSFGEEIMPEDCRLPPGSRCGVPRKALDGYCLCQQGYYCNGTPGICVKM